MATTSKRISELPLYTNQQYNPAWLTCRIPANFYSTDPVFPDTFQVPITSLMMSMGDGGFSGNVSILKNLKVGGPVVLGEENSKNKSYIFIYKGTSYSTSEVSLTKPQNSLLTIPNNTSWFFKVFVIGKSTDSTASSTNIEFIGLIKRNNLGTVSLVGTTTKMIHSRENLSTDAFLEADDSTGEKTIKIKVKGGSISSPYVWTARVDIVEA